MSKNKKLNLTAREAVKDISKKLKIKFLKEGDDFKKNYRIQIRKYNTLKRIEKLINSDIYESKYSNANKRIEECSTHYYLDFWIQDILITITYDKDEKENRIRT
jgi:hypothetical protein